MANKRIYHDIITCSVKDTARMEKLADSSKIVALKDLKFGLHVVVVISWIQQKFRLQSSDIGKLMKEDPLKRATAKKVWNLAVEATVKGDKTAVLGGNIILPKAFLAQTALQKKAILHRISTKQKPNPMRCICVRKVLC